VTTLCASTQQHPHNTSGQGLPVVSGHFRFARHVPSIRPCFLSSRADRPLICFLSWFMYHLWSGLTDRGPKVHFVTWKGCRTEILSIRFLGVVCFWIQPLADHQTLAASPSAALTCLIPRWPGNLILTVVLQVRFFITRDSHVLCLLPQIPYGSLHSNDDVTCRGAVLGSKEGHKSFHLNNTATFVVGIAGQATRILIMLAADKIDRALASCVLLPWKDTGRERTRLKWSDVERVST
jgi:hypothetical protein